MYDIYGTRCTLAVGENATIASSAKARRIDSDNNRRLTMKATNMTERISGRN